MSDENESKSGDESKFDLKFNEILPWNEPLKESLLTRVCRFFRIRYRYLRYHYLRYSKEGRESRDARKLVKLSPEELSHLWWPFGNLYTEPELKAFLAEKWPCLYGGNPSPSRAHVPEGVLTQKSREAWYAERQVPKTVPAYTPTPEEQALLDAGTHRVVCRHLIKDEDVYRAGMEVVFLVLPCDLSACEGITDVRQVPSKDFRFIITETVVVAVPRTRKKGPTQA